MFNLAKKINGSLLFVSLKHYNPYLIQNLEVKCYDFPLQSWKKKCFKLSLKVTSRCHEENSKQVIIFKKR